MGDCTYVPRLTIGFVIDDVMGVGGYRAKLWASVAEAAREQDVNLICFTGGALGESAPVELARQRNTVYDLPSENNVAGLILASGVLATPVPREVYAAFYHRYRPLPMVSIGLAEEVPSVLIDNVMGIHRLVDHLIEAHAYQRIAFICGPQHHADAEARRQAYGDALAAHGVSLDPALVVPGDFSPHSGREAVRVLWDERARHVDAIIAVTDVVALGAVQALQARGVRVPQDVAVVGFDDVDDALASVPPLTTVRQPFYEQGRKAMEMILALLAGEEIPPRVSLSTELVIRQSCGCFGAAVVQAPAQPPQPPQAQSLEGGSAAQRESALAEMVDAVDDPTLAREDVVHWAERLLDAFWADLAGERSGASFLRVLDGVLQQGMVDQSGMTAWQEAISALRRALLPHLADRETLLRAVDLWEGARILIGDAARRRLTRQRLQVERHVEALHDVSLTLSTPPDMQALGDEVIRRLPRLGIERCYILLRKDPSSPESPVRLMMAYTYDADTPRRDIWQEDGPSYPAAQLLPQGVLGEERYHLLVEALCFHEQNFGFIILGVGPVEGMLYATLCEQITSAIKDIEFLEAHRQAQRELERSNKELEHFAYVVSHDLQEPLRMVKSYVQLLERRYKGQLDEDADDFIAYAVDGAGRMQHMINDLLTYSRVGTRGKPFEPTDTAAVLENALANLAIAIQESQAAITYDDLPVVWGDSVQLTQLLQNLIGNAIKFRKPDQPPRIHVGVKPMDGEWVFSVRDNGIGIDPDRFDRLFKIFQRLHSQDEYEGTGIGLALCKRIVERHAGRIWVEAQPGEGATFYFTLLAVPSEGDVS